VAPSSISNNEEIYIHVANLLYSSTVKKCIIVAENVFLCQTSLPSAQMRNGGQYI